MESRRGIQKQWLHSVVLPCLVWSDGTRVGSLLCVAAEGRD